MRWLGTSWIVGNLLVFAGLFLGLSVQAGERKEIAGTDQHVRTISQMVVHPTDRPNHHLTQQVMMHTTASTDPDFNNLVVTTYEQSDSVKATGSHKGYRIQRHESGDESYVQYEGTHAVEIKDGGAHEAHFEGTWQIIGGKGKFEDITGSGTYQGTQTEEGMTTEWKGEVEY